MDKEVYTLCKRCGRKLKSLESKKIGMGKVCWSKYKSESNRKKLFGGRNNDTDGTNL